MAGTNAWTPLWLTLQVASLATLLAFVAGVTAAYAVARWRIPGKEWIDAVLTLPMVLPPTVLGYYLILVVGRHGVVGRWLQEHLDFSLMFTWQGAVIAAAVVSFPLVFKSARASYEGVETQLENAARTLGMSEPAVFARVTFPLAWRGILAGTLLGYARAMGEFGATLMVAGNLPGRTQTLSLAIYDAVQGGDDDVANFLVLVTSAVCIATLVISARMLRVRYA
jgi:molybdate transport system permease protein